MHPLKNYRRYLGIGFLCLMASSQFASAQFYTNNPNGDLICGLRKTGSAEGTHEVVIDLGNVTNLLAMSPGASITMSNFPATLVTNVFANGYSNLQWSVFSSLQSAATPWTNSFGVYPPDSDWYTLPGTNATTQTSPPPRYSHTGMALLDAKMYDVNVGARTISSGIGSTNADNNSVLVAESTSLDNQGNDTLDDLISDQTTPSTGDFGGGTFTNDVENVLPASFTTTARSDFYQSVPNTGSPQFPGHTDPITGQTTGSAYFVGYFLLSPSGVMTFTRAVAVAPPPPPAPVLNIARTGTTSTITFGTTNGATYQLYYTTLSGITTRRSTWTASGSPITGTGSTTNITDTTTDPGRVYSVTAQ
jgi:hypothetical protein